MTGVMGTFGTIPATGGAQLTVDKAPLYTFAMDKDSGDRYGQGVLGIWWTAVAGTGTHMAILSASSPVKEAAAKMLVTATGMSLYVFDNDTPSTAAKPGSSACTGQCLTYWPALTVPTGTKPPATMAGIKGKFGTIMRADGSMQLTYDGAPLYTFAGDKKPGDLKGQGVISKWWAIAS
jgi:predicted lipoprotein with Yx(FWY)xxD motif